MLAGFASHDPRFYTVCSAVPLPFRVFGLRFQICALNINDSGTGWVADSIKGANEGDQKGPREILDTLDTLDLLDLP